MFLQWNKYFGESSFLTCVLKDDEKGNLSQSDL